MRILTLLGFLFAFSFGDNVTENLPENHPFYETSSGIKQIEKIIAELKETLGDIPPSVEKIAIYQIRTDSKGFTKGESRYIQGRIETTLRDEGRRTLVSPPELKTLNIISTDTSFSMSNTIPTIEELWKLGDKLRIDAFIEGSCSKSKDGDVMLNLKLVKHRTAEILWSGDFIAGPNKVEPSIFDLKWSAHVPIRIFSMEKFEGQSGIDKETGFNQVAIEGSVTEALTKNRRLWFNINAGVSRMAISKKDSIELGYSGIYTMQIGVGVWAVLVPKGNRDRGHWLGTYFSAYYYVPFLFTGSIPVFTYGYNAQLSKHFGVSIGVSYIAGDRFITGSLGDAVGHKITFEKLAYEVDILNYTF